MSAVATRRDTGVRRRFGRRIRKGLLRHPWVVIKLVLIVTVIVVGATVLRPVLADEGNPGSAPLIVGAAYDVAALTVATALAVFKPGRTAAA